MTDTVAVGLIGACASVIAAAFAAWAAVISRRSDRKVDSIQIEIDGRLSQLLASVGKEQHALGHSEGVEAERTRQP